MQNQSEFHFLESILAKLHLQYLLLTPDHALDAPPDLGLRKLLGHTSKYMHLLNELPFQMEHRTIYKVTDPYLCNYLFLRFPDDPCILLIGPYLSVQLTHQQLLKEAERYQLPPALFQQMKTYYASIPYLNDEAFFLAIINTFAESLWGGSDAYSMVVLTQDLNNPSPISRQDESVSPEQTLRDMQTMERRYAYENEMLQAVSQGLSHKAQLMLSHLSQLSMEQRVADPVRNLKNYCIIMNSLLRKAAERGGVHPLYLDKTSSEFAHRIETLSTLPALQKLMEEMMRSYCLLVKKHAFARYSAPVCKTLICIDADLSGDLTLHTLCSMQNLSSGYLSTLFKKEVGQTLTDYVNTKRIEQAVNMLRTGTLQVQTIAQYCGIPDVNYFSKVFKRYIGMSPKEFRHSMQPRGSKT